MKNDSLKEFVNKNREGFDAQTPPENVWQRIEAGLPKFSKQIFWNSVSLWRAAAIVLFGLSSYLLFVKNSPNTEKQDVAAIQGFNDLETYYSSQIAEKMNLVSSSTILQYFYKRSGKNIYVRSPGSHYK